MRAALVLMLGASLLGGCASAPCAGYAGTCVELRIEGDVPGMQLDQLQITLAGARTGSQTSLPSPAARFELPAQLALHLGPGISGSLVVVVEGRLGPDSAAVGQTQLTLRSDEHSALTVTLHSTLVGRDGGFGDGASVSDGPIIGGPPDAPAPDLALAPRIMFMTRATTGGAFAAGPVTAGGVAAIDALCAAAATLPGHSPSLDGKTFKTFVTRPDLASLASDLKINPASQRPIVDVDGVSFTDERFLLTPQNSSKGPRLDEAGKTIGGGDAQCAWTGFPAPGTAAASGPNCTNWTNAATLTSGMSGTITSSTWQANAVDPCTAGCRLYCLEVP